MYKKLVQYINDGKKVCLRTSFKQKQGSISELEKIIISHNELSDSDLLAISKGIPSTERKEDATIVLEPFYPSERLIVLGGGHVALPVVEFAAKTGFSVSVIDDRISFANKERFPLAKQVICDGFEHALDELRVRKEDYIVIITRGHRYDSTCLKKVCEGIWPSYVGMIGSKRRTAIVKDILEQDGCSKELLNQVHTPIGLNIGAITPEEIAISIIAELILHKRLSCGDQKQINQSDVDYDVLKTLAEETSIPKAVLTIISTKGSVPRGAGAKMLVYLDGRIQGSIGGGCSEAAVMNTARKIIGTNRYETVDVDLTGEAAEEEGMVCGGIMTVLIEDYKLNA